MDEFPPLERERGREKGCVCLGGWVGGWLVEELVQGKRLAGQHLAIVMSGTLPAPATEHLPLLPSAGAHRGAEAMWDNFWTLGVLQETQLSACECCASVNI